MTPILGLAMIVRDEEAVIGRALDSVLDLVGAWTVIDTGSTDNTRDIVTEKLGHLPGELLESEWRDFGSNLTELMEYSRDQAQWNLRLHADMVVDAHEGFTAFLAADEDPDTQAWQVGVEDPGGYFYRYPYLTRGGLEWWYVGATHEHLAPLGRKQRPLLGLTLHHHADGANRAEKFARDIELLRPAVEKGDARAVFYTAQSLEHLGRLEEAAEAYHRRDAMGGWEEEAWYSAYRVGRLTGDVDALIRAWERRPWRHEPLAAAAAIVASRGARDDLLFMEPPASPPPAMMSSVIEEESA